MKRLFLAPVAFVAHFFETLAAEDAARLAECRVVAVVANGQIRRFTV